MIGLLSPSGGSVFMDNILLNSLSPSQRIIKGLCYLPQESSLFSDLSVLSNIECALELRGMSHAKNRRTYATDLLKLLNIETLSDKKTLVLSGGQRRRVEFARLLACQPRFVLLDEPFAGVDPLSINDIQEQIKILQQHGIGILISDHNIHATLNICHSAHVLIHGNMIASGTKEEIYANKKVQECYLGV
jgi:lipopolysaccharide export system ATP-binding protein